MVDFSELLDYLPWLLIALVALLGMWRIGFHGGVGMAFLCMLFTCITSAMGAVWIGEGFTALILIGFLRMPNWLWWTIFIVAIGAALLWWQGVI